VGINKYIIFEACHLNMHGSVEAGYIKIIFWLINKHAKLKLNKKKNQAIKEKKNACTGRLAMLSLLNVVEVLAADEEASRVAYLWERVSGKTGDLETICYGRKCRIKYSCMHIYIYIFM
jgi:hypothetical protein